MYVTDCLSNTNFIKKNILQSYLNNTLPNKTIGLFSKLSQHNQIVFWILCNVVGKPLDNCFAQKLRVHEFLYVPHLCPNPTKLKWFIYFS
jgi:hypothetical protein